MRRALAVLGAIAAASTLPLAARPASTPAAEPAAGGLVVFARRTGTGTSALYVVRPDGSGLRKLSRSPVDFDPAWTPDGRRLVFASSRGGRAGAPELYVRDLAGRRVVRLTRTPRSSTASAANIEPSVGLDGKRVVFVRESAGGRDLYSVPLAGGGVRRLTRTPGREATPETTASDGVIFERDGWIYESHAGSTRRIARGIQPARDPATGLLAFAFRGAIWISDGGTPRAAVEGSADGGRSEPAFSPDGRRLVYVAPDGLFSVDLDGSDRRRLTKTSPLVHDTAPAWQPRIR